MDDVADWIKGHVDDGVTPAVLDDMLEAVQRWHGRGRPDSDEAVGLVLELYREVKGYATFDELHLK